MDIHVIPHYGVRAISNRAPSCSITISDEGSGGYVSSGFGDAGDVAFVLAGSYLGAALGWLAGAMLVAWLGA